MNASLLRRVLLPLCALVFAWSGCTGPISLRKPLTFVWYGLARQGDDDNTTYVPLEDGVTLATNDGVQIFMTVKPEAYVYVFHQTSTGQFTVLWPTAERDFSAHLEAGRVQTIPSRGRVYAMPLSRGTEALYLIASREPVNSVDALMKEMRWLFASAQAIAAGVPDKQIRDDAPRGLKWQLDRRNPVPIRVVDQHIQVGTTIQSIGKRRMGGQVVVPTAEGGTYTVSAEQLQGKNVVARVVRVRRVVSR